MNQRTTFLTLLSLFLSGSLLAESRFVTETLPIPLRVSPCDQCKILQWGIPSGLQMEYLGEQEKWTHVKTEGGQEGWIETQFLKKNPVVHAQDAKVQAELDRLNTENSELRDQINALFQGLNLDPGNSPGDIEQQMNQLITLTSGAISMGKQSEDLMKRNQSLQHELDLMRADNDRLRDEQWKTWFAYGGLAVIAGALLAVILPHLRRRKRSYSEWG